VAAVADDGFRDFVLNESAGLLRTGWMLTGDRTLAEDLLQTALAKTWPHWPRISQNGTPTAYVRTVMIRTYASWTGRRWTGETPSDVLPEHPTDDHAYTALDERDQLARALAQLPRKQRAVIVLRYYLDYSEQQTADTLKCSIGTVKAHAARGLTRLRATTDPTARERERQ
jgi:RNA polymerase sigma-70 factor (sigma-E family)